MVLNKNSQIKALFMFTMCKKHPCITTVREHLTQQKSLKKYGGFSPHANDTFTINVSPSLAYYADWYYTYVLTSVLGESEELKLWCRVLRREPVCSTSRGEESVLNDHHRHEFQTANDGYMYNRHALQCYYKQIHTQKLVFYTAFHVYRQKALV